MRQIDLTRPRTSREPSNFAACKGSRIETGPTEYLVILRFLDVERALMASAPMERKNAGRGEVIGRSWSASLGFVCSARGCPRSYQIRLRLYGAVAGACKDGRCAA